MVGRLPSAKAIRKDNPLGHKLYKKYLTKIISRPSESALENIYQDNNGGISGYIPDEVNDSNAFRQKDSLSMHDSFYIDDKTTSIV